MERRTGDTPMDFEYDNRLGQRSANSPFPKGDPNKRGFASQSSMRPELTTTFQSSTVFGVSSSQNRNLPQTPQKTKLYRENPSFDFSSGAENQSSPDNADNEDTPDMPKVSNAIGENVTLFRGKSPSKLSPSRRDSFTNFFRFGRPRNDTSRTTQNGALQRRVHKRKRRELERDNQLYRRGSEDSDWDRSRPSSSEGAPTKDTAQPIKEMGTIPAVFSFIHAHPNLPHILSYYGQLVLTTFFVSLIIWAVWLGFQAIQNDINIAAGEEAAKIIEENAKCASEYARNRCSGERDTPPALIDQCSRWLACMSRDPMQIGRAKVGAGTMAQVLNNFVEPMSWKLITCILGALVAAFVVPEWAFGSLRKKEAPVPYPHMATPYQQQNQPPGVTEVFFTPQHQRHGDEYGGGTSPSRRERSRESPTKAIGYR